LWRTAPGKDAANLADHLLLHRSRPSEVRGLPFLFGNTRAVFADAGFEYIRPLGTVRCVMRRTVASA
jgi:hypothetical protein